MAALTLHGLQGLLMPLPVHQSHGERPLMVVCYARVLVSLALQPSLDSSASADFMKVSLAAAPAAD